MVHQVYGEKELTGHVITACYLRSSNFTFGTQFRLSRKMFFSSGLLDPLRFSPSSCNICTGDFWVPLYITSNASAAVTLSTDYVAVIIGITLLTGLAVGKATTLEVAAG